MSSATAASQSSTSSSTSSSTPSSTPSSDHVTHSTVQPVLEEYFRRNGGSRFVVDSKDNPSAADIKEWLDPITDITVGQAKVKEEIFPYAPLFLQTHIGKLFARGKWNQHVKFEEKLETMKKKWEAGGTPLTHVKRLEALALDHLSTNAGGNLFECIELKTDSKEYYKLSKKWEDHEARSRGEQPLDDHHLETHFQHANLFFIDKNRGIPPKKLRIIVDARCINGAVNTEGLGFDLFSLELLHKILGSMSKDAHWYSVHTDLRHYYHQLLLDASLRDMCVMRVCEGNSVKFYRPRSLPMGLVFAPAIAQSCTYGMLLGSDTKTAYGKRIVMSNAAELDLDMDYVNGLTALPRFIPLKHGGGLFVLLDNIQVVTPLPQVAQAWQKHIDKRTARCNVKVKYPTKLVTLRCGAIPHLEDNHFEFVGILWAHSHCHVKVDPKIGPEGFKAWTNSSHLAAYWNGTHRHLSHDLGTLLWYYRGTRTPMYRADMQQFRQLYVLAAPRPTVSYDTALTDLDVSLQHYLLAQWQQRQRHGENLKNMGGWNAYAPQNTLPGIMSGVVDASSKVRLLGCYLHDPALGRHWVWQGRHPHETHTEIALAELKAILAFVKWCDQHYARRGMFVIGTDNLNAKAWIEKQVSNRVEANPVLAELFETLGSREIYPFYIPSEDNFADIPSRRFWKNEDLDLELSPQSVGYAEAKAVRSFTVAMKEEGAIERLSKTHSQMRRAIVEATNPLIELKNKNKERQKDEQEERK